MPVIDGKYYDTDDTSWWDDLINKLSQKQAPPPSPVPPKVDEDALESSVDQSRINTLTVHDVGLIVSNETQSFSNRPNSNEPIDAARQKIAHAVMNGDQLKGFARPSTAQAIEPSAGTLRNPLSAQRMIPRWPRPDERT